VTSRSSSKISNKTSINGFQESTKTGVYDMPCYDERSTYDYGKKEGEAERKRLEERCNVNARVACEAFRFIEYLLDGHGQVGDFAFHVSADAQRWWKEHKEFDKKRKK
jgi:hypothetical protein